MQKTLRLFAILFCICNPNQIVKQDYSLSKYRFLKRWVQHSVFLDHILSQPDIGFYSSATGPAQLDSRLCIS
jgi:hypothetical protein